MSSNLYLSECPSCTHVDPDTNKRIVRTVKECKDRGSMYCYICLIYRHTMEECPNKIACAIRRGESIEGVTNNILCVEDTKKGIEDVLNKYKVPTKGKKKNSKILRHLASSIDPPRILHFV